jgi:hypothetical protein
MRPGFLKDRFQGQIVTTGFLVGDHLRLEIR